ncbi:MAG: wax ester/triacylglycerol synthase family O-acyltransferase [Myxococcota bacterium]
MADPSRPAITFDDTLSDADSLMLALESDPVLRSTILSTWVLDRTPDLARFERKLERALQVIPRLRQRIVHDPLGLANPRWERDPDFDLRFHLRRSRLGGDGSVRDLLDHAAPIAMQAFDMDRPLWELHLVEGLEGGRCAAIMKLHHAISDGVGLVKMTGCLIERGPEDEELPPLPAESASDVAPPSAWERIGEALSRRVRSRVEGFGAVGATLAREAGQALRDPAGRVRQARDTLASVARVLSPASEPMSPLWRDRSTRVHFDYLPVSLEELKRAGRTQGGSVNDAFVAAVGGGLARYHASHGAPVEALRMLMPVNVRAGERADHAGNQFAPARFEVPVGIADPARRIRAVRHASRVQRDEPALPLVEPISSALGRLPSQAVVGLFGAMQRTTDFTTSNVPGPRRATWMSGARVEAFMPFGPLAGAAVNVTVFSYDGIMHVGINSDPAAIPDPELLLECLRKSFDEVLSVIR